MTYLGLTPGDAVLAGTCTVLLAWLMFQVWTTPEEPMRILICEGKLYVDGVRLCLVEVGNGCSNFESGRWPATVKSSEMFGREMVWAEGFGWLGDSGNCSAVFGHVRGRYGLLADPLASQHLVSLVYCAEQAGQKVILEVQ